MGYPRSGNTFLAFAFEKFYENKIKNSPRYHSTIDIKLNFNKNICVVIRDPIKCIASWNNFRTEQKVHLGKNLTLDADFNYYLRYYNFVEKNLDKVELMNFEKFSKDSNYIVNKIEKRFNIKPFITLDSESLKKELMNSGGKDFLPKELSINRQKTEEMAFNHSLYKDAKNLYDYLINKETINNK
jgi:hypothetical protein